MAREMTPQERAAAIVDKVKSALTPIWLGGRQRMLLEQEIAEALTATRRAALLEAAHKVRDRALLWRSHGGAKVGFPYGHLTIEGEYESMADELDRLAQEG